MIVHGFPTEEVVRTSLLMEDLIFTSGTDSTCARGYVRITQVGFGEMIKLFA